MSKNIHISHSVHLYSCTSFSKPPDYIFQQIGAAAYCNAIILRGYLYHGYYFKHIYITMQIKPSEWKHRKAVK